MDPDAAKSRLCIGRDAKRWRGQPGHSDTSGWFAAYFITASAKAHIGLQNRSMVKWCLLSLVWGVAVLTTGCVAYDLLE